MRLSFVLATSLVTLMLPRLAFATTEAPIPGAPATAPLRDLSITFSPLHLAVPAGEVTGEYRLQDRMSVAGIVGFGSVGSASMIEGGAQYRYYLLGDFEHGLNLGAEALFVSAGSSNDVAGGLAAGPFVGYKFAAGFGLTFDIQGGAQYMAVSNGSSSAAQFIPLINLNAGWTF